MKKIKAPFLLTFLIFSCLIGSAEIRGGEVLRVRDTDSIIYLKMFDIYLGIDLRRGGRIVSFKIGESEVLSSNGVHRFFYGSTLWLSPEKKWSRTGPYDIGQFEVKSFDKKVLEISELLPEDSPRDFSFDKQFEVGSADTSIIINYIINNISGSDQLVAPWEVTRVPTGGVAVTSLRNAQDSLTRNSAYPLLKVEVKKDIVWYPFDSSAISPEKLFMNGKGWIAYARNGLLFVKKFPVIGPEFFAPEEKNIEIYVNKEKTYVELENQGAYENVRPGSNLNYQVKWYLRRLPAGIKIEAGNINLLNYINSIVSRE